MIFKKDEEVNFNVLKALKHPNDSDNYSRIDVVDGYVKKLFQAISSSEPLDGCHLPIELEHKAFWLIKKLNFDLQAASKKQLEQLNKIDKFRQMTYKNTKLYKEKTRSGMISTFLTESLHQDKKSFYLTHVYACF